MNIHKKNIKRMVIHINNSQKTNLQEFLSSINFYTYTVQTKLEGSWAFDIRHLNTHIWPGSEAIFHLIVSSSKTDFLLRKLKHFRMQLPENVVMAILICPLDEFIENMHTADIEEDSNTNDINWDFD